MGRQRFIQAARKKSCGSDLLPSLGKVLVFVPGLFILLGKVALSQIAAELGKFNSSIEEV